MSAGRISKHHGGLGGACLAALVNLAAVTAVSLTPAAALADGGFISPFGKDIWEPSQLALILYDREEEQEDLILQVAFEGETRDFGWIVPVPSLPTLETAEALLFWDCSRLTQPVVRRRGGGCALGEDDGARVGPPFDGNEGGGVDVYDQQTVGIFLTLTLGADNAGALTDSLTAWGYLHDANRETVEEALQFYIDKSWYFVAMRIDSSSTFPQRPGGYWYGPIDPIRLTFETAEPIYPLRISAISARDPTEVLLYVCASHRTIFDGAKTEYANWFSESELRAVESDYLYLSDVMDDSCFMTKLRRSFSPDEMTDDLILERAPTDREFREIRFVGIPLADGLMVAMLGGLGLTSRRLRRRGRT